MTTIICIIGFPAHFVTSSFNFVKNVLSISSRTLWNVRMLVSISSLVDQFWNIAIQFRDLSPVFVNCNSNSSVTVGEHKTAKSISSIGIHFRQSFTKILLPDIRYNAVIIALSESFTSHIYVALIIVFYIKHNCSLFVCDCKTMSTKFNKGYKISREIKMVKDLVYPQYKSPYNTWRIWMTKWWICLRKWRIWF